jgi:hypothetical protein
MIKMISLTTFKEYLGNKENYTYVNDEPTEKPEQITY